MYIFLGIPLHNYSRDVFMCTHLYRVWGHAPYHVFVSTYIIPYIISYISTHKIPYFQSLPYWLTLSEMPNWEAGLKHFGTSLLAPAHGTASRSGRASGSRGLPCLPWNVRGSGASRWYARRSWALSSLLMGLPGLLFGRPLRIVSLLSWWVWSTIVQ